LVSVTVVVVLFGLGRLVHDGCLRGVELQPCCGLAFRDPDDGTSASLYCG
jgi:hypothetical protein